MLTTATNLGTKVCTLLVVPIPNWIGEKRLQKQPITQTWLCLLLVIWCYVLCVMLHVFAKLCGGFGFNIEFLPFYTTGILDINLKTWTSRNTFTTKRRGISRKPRFITFFRRISSCLGTRYELRESKRNFKAIAYHFSRDYLLSPLPVFRKCYDLTHQRNIR